MTERASARVFATGYGVVSPFGWGVPAAIAGLRCAQQCARPVRLALPHPPEALQVLAALVPAKDGALDAERDVHPAESFLLAAVREALAMAGHSGHALPFYVGTCSGEMRAFERFLTGERSARDGRWYEAPAENVATRLGLGRAQVFASACTSSLGALHAAASAIRRGELDAAIVAGTDATCAFAVSGFVTLRAASQAPARPFSRSRSGLNFGEGAAALLLESEAAVLRRGVTPRLVLLGTGLSADAKHITAPRADARGLELALTAALARAGLTPRALDVYVAHGTGTPANDAMELALGARLGLLDKPWLAHKGFIGHALGASGLMSLVLANEQLRLGVSPAPGYDDLEPGVRLGAALGEARVAAVAAAAFGGSNAAAVWEARPSEPTSAADGLTPSRSVTEAR